MIAFFAVWILNSCVHKELYYDNSKMSEVQVVFDWKNAPDAAPEAMCLYLYPVDGSKPLSYEFADFRGGHISIPSGHYKVLCLNSDTESILYRNTGSYEGFEAYTPDEVLGLNYSSAPRAEGTLEERIAASPDCLYSASLDDVLIECSKENQVLVLYPEASVCRYQVKIVNVSNLEYISSDGILATLSGLSGGLLVGHKKLTSEAVTVPFELVSDGVSTLTTDFFVFGKSDAMNKLVLYVILSDGSKKYYTFDVSHQIEEAADPYDVCILLDGLNLPKPINDDGFHPVVDEWQEIDVDISM